MVGWWQRSSATKSTSKHGLIAFDCFCIGPETSGWFRREIKNADEYEGHQDALLRSWREGHAKDGRSDAALAAADIFPALERGVIDATEFSMPAMDQKQGFQQVAKFNYFPGWHQLVSCSEVLMNKKAFDALPEPYKAMIRVAATAGTAYNYAESEAGQFSIMAEMKEKNGVQFKRWSDEDLAKYEAAWLDVIKEESAKDPLFKKVSDHYLEFRKKYAIWGDAQYMKGTYLKK